jgi:hypothetical protein
MTFPVVEGRSKTTWPGPTATTSHAITLPSGIVAGELLFVVAHTDDLASASGMSASAGWTEVCDVANTNTHRLAAYSKIAEGSDSLTITLSTSSERLNYICWRISGARAVYASSTTATGSSDYPDPPNCAPGIGTKDFLWIAAAGYLSVGTSAYSAFPSGYSNTNDMPASTRSGTVIHLLGTCEKTANGSSENPGTFSGHVGAPSEYWIAKTFAIEPSSGVNPLFFGAGL